MRIPNLGYRFAFWQGNATRRIYRALLPWIVRQRIDPPRQIDLEVFAYSNEEMLPEQVASIRSFLRHAGRPQSFTVVSDGSHSPGSIRLLEEIDPAVQRSVGRSGSAGSAGEGAPLFGGTSHRQATRSGHVAAAD